MVCIEHLCERMISLKIADKKWFTVLLQSLITISMALGALIILALPYVVYYALHYYENVSSFSKEYYTICLCVLYPSGLLGFAILYEARKLLMKINKSQPFISENVKCIKYIAT